MTLQKIIKKHQTFLQKTPQIFFSPGRVNLIGEHIDYLGGNVFPTAISLGTYAFVTIREDREFHFLSDNFSQFAPKIVQADDLEYKEERNWANYPVGMLEAFAKRGVTYPFGLNVLIYGTLPNGAGLSSSASLEVLMGVVIETVYHHPIQRVELVQMAQRVENEYIGVHCGIMDQFAVGMGQNNHAIYLNTNTLEYKLVPLELQNDVIVIANTNKKRSLADSQYNQRRKECDIGLRIVQEHYPDISALCEVTSEQLERIQSSFDNHIIYRRVHHAVHEQQRTEEAVQALEKQDLMRFGELLNASHQSLRDDYEVSCRELDVMAQAFVDAGAKGARMTGAGFGGCVVAIVAKENVSAIIDTVQTTYQSNTTYQPAFYICETSDGTHEITKEVLV